MNDIAGRLIDLDDDSYIDEEENEEDLDDDLDDNLDDEDNHMDVQSSVKFGPSAAMTEDEVKVRYNELQIITTKQFVSPKTDAT